MKFNNSRLLALRKKMQAGGADLVAVGPGSHMDWILGFHPEAGERLCLLLIGRHEHVLVLSALHVGGLLQQQDICVRTWDDADGPDATVAGALASLEADRAESIVLEESMRADVALLLLKLMPYANHQYASEIIGPLRMRKDHAELNCLKMNAQIADRVILKALSTVKTGMSEAELEHLIKSGFYEEGGIPVLSIAASGPSSALPYPKACRKIQDGDVVLIDVGGRKDGFASDITRMAFVGDPSKSYLKVHAIVEDAVCAALEAAKPGVPASSVDAAARSVITRAGYGQYFNHRLGHGIGIDLHEPPYISEKSATVLEEGMVFSIEPGIYLPGQYGVRLEEIVVLGHLPEVLSSVSREVFVAGGM
ncbi:hypothetical protein B5E41_30295 [Rhizobium esperanzae]|uniref:Peptidase M24 n=1 Tax=Rhizobium esperanzae TaxID=1967781 RepID=A0A246DKL6_9HYPH|nr:M24 family metallopeptidase [Rhizobium esperanzae]OWO89571.1 hypothetical protein B5E41_30295 [Rhizobium esperanzae]